jgi:hypothetical protein
MTKSILKTLAFGAIVGAALFFIPKFLLSIFLFFVLIRLLVGRRMGHGKFNRYQFVYADKIRNMNDEEYSEFKNKMETRSCCYSPKTASTK